MAPETLTDPRPIGDDRLAPPALIAALLAVVAGFAATRAWRMPVNGDAAWYLYMAGRVLDGATPYVDVVDTNPPPIVLLNVGLVAMARGLGGSPLDAFPLALLTLSVVSLTLAWRLGRGLPRALREASLLAWAYLLTVYVGTIFGQREHLTVILTLPYTFGAIAEARGERTPAWLGVISGLLAGLGFVLKPFFVPAFAVVELYLFMRRGVGAWRRPEAVAAALVVVGSALTVIVWAPQYLDVARRFAPLYPHHNPGGSWLLTRSWRLAVVVGAFAIALRAGRTRAEGWAAVFGLLAAAYTGGVYMTGKGWLYHWYPPLAIALALGAGALALRRPRPARLPIALALGLPTLCLVSTVDALSVRRDDAAVALVAAHVRPGESESVLVLSPWVHRSFPMVNETDAAWGMRHPMLWQVAAFYAGEPWSAVKPPYHALDAMSPAERRFVAEISDDFARSRPTLLFVDLDPPTPARPGFDYLAYLSVDPKFARTLADYEYLDRTAWFRVYRRRGPELAHVPKGD